MVLESYSVFWKEYASDTYTYGAKIRFRGPADVEYENEWMPPGTIIKQWYSKTDFGSNRIEPALPIIDGEGTYRLLSDIEREAGENLLLRLVFYDRFENEVDSLSIWEPAVQFRCPLKAYSYRLQLINGGMTRFRFHSIVIQEISDENDVQN